MFDYIRKKLIKALSNEKLNKKREKKN